MDLYKLKYLTWDNRNFICSKRWLNMDNHKCLNIKEFPNNMPSLSLKTQIMCSHKELEWEWSNYFLYLFYFNKQL